MDLFAEKHRLSLIVALGLFLRFLLLAGAAMRGDVQLLHEGDTGTYQAMAYSFAHGDWLFQKGEARTMSYTRTPGYPLFMGVVYAIGAGDFGLAFLQVLLDGAAIYLMYRLGERLGGVGAPAALLYALSPLFISFSFQLVSESFFVLVFLIANEMFFRGMERRMEHKKRTEKRASADAASMLVVGLVFGFLILIRPIALPFPVLYALAYYWKTREWKGTLALLGGAFALAGLWLVRNVVVLNSFEFSRIGSISYVCWTGPLLANDPRVDTGPWQQEYAQFGLRHPDDCTQKIFNQTAEASRVVDAMVAAYPLVYAQHLANAALLLFAPQTPNYVMDILGQERPHLAWLLFERGLDISFILEAVSRNGIYFMLLALFTLYQFALYLLFLLGMVRSAKGRWVGLLAVLILLIIVAVQGPQILFSGYRYRMPAEPLLILGAAQGLGILWGKKN